MKDPALLILLVASSAIGGAWTFYRSQLAELLYDLRPVLPSIPTHAGIAIVGTLLYALPGIVAYCGAWIAYRSLVIPIRLGWDLAGGVLLGCAIAGAAFVIVELYYRLAFRLGRRRLAFRRAGWLRHYNIVADQSWALSSLLMLLVVSAEELGFRGALMPLIAHTYGVGPAIVASTALFVLIQIPGMPSLSDAMPPIIGAAVLGTVHAVLVVATGAIAAMIVSHFVYFMLLTNYRTIVTWIGAPSVPWHANGR